MKVQIAHRIREAGATEASRLMSDLKESDLLALAHALLATTADDPINRSAVPSELFTTAREHPSPIVRIATLLAQWEALPNGLTGSDLQKHGEADPDTKVRVASNLLLSTMQHLSGADVTAVENLVTQIMSADTTGMSSRAAKTFLNKQVDSQLSSLGKVAKNYTSNDGINVAAIMAEILQSPQHTIQALRQLHQAGTLVLNFAQLRTLGSLSRWLRPNLAIMAIETLGSASALAAAGDELLTTAEDCHWLPVRRAALTALGEPRIIRHRTRLNAIAENESTPLVIRKIAFDAASGGQRAITLELASNHL